MTMTNTATATRPTWILHNQTTEETQVHCAIVDGVQVFRLRTANLNDTFAVMVRGKLHTRATLRGAVKLGNS